MPAIATRAEVDESFRRLTDLWLDNAQLCREIKTALTTPPMSAHPGAIEAFPTPFPTPFPQYCRLCESKKCPDCGGCSNGACHGCECFATDCIVHGDQTVTCDGFECGCDGCREDAKGETL